MEENPKPRRRWFRFSLRTMLVLVTVMAILLTMSAYPNRWIRERRAFRVVHSNCEMLPDDTEGYNISDKSAPWPLFIYGEFGVAAWNGNLLSRDEVDEAVRLFPEADIIFRYMPATQD
jgi:hypothetical protein